jgi:hypothetical protein
MLLAGQPFVTGYSVHGPLKLKTVHFGDITIIYESKVSEQNIFPWLKGTVWEQRLFQIWGKTAWKMWLL